MSKFIGRLTDVGLARELTRGTGVVPTFWVPKVSFSFDDKIEKAITTESLGVIEDSSEANIVARYGEGDFEGEIRDKSFGLLLYGLTGSCSTAANGAAYDHTFTAANTNSHTSLSLMLEDDIADRMFRLAMINELNISANLGEVVKFKTGFVSRPSQSYSPQTPSYGAENRFTACHSNLYIDAYADIDTATAINARSVSLTITKNLMRDHAIGTCTPIDIHNQQLQIEGEIVLNLEDHTYRDYMLNNDYKALRLKLVNTGVDLGGGVNPTLNITLSRVHFYDWTPERPNDEISTQTVSFKAFYDVENTRQAIASIVLTNGQATY
jgi:hypothetical protein